MHEDLLLDIGFTRSEIAVYFALLDLGSSTTGPIIKKAGIASGKAYLLLDKLVEKGVVTYAVRSGTRYYQAKDPDRLLDYMHEKELALKEKEEKLRKFLPTLKAQYEEKKYRPTAEVFEGVKGFKTFYELILKEVKKGDSVYVLGVPRVANERFEGLLMDWNRRRIEKGVLMRIIYNHDCRDFGTKRTKMELTEVRYMKQGMETPAWIDIFHDYVATLNVHGTPVGFLMKDHLTAETYKRYFEMIWSQAEE